MRKAHRMLRLHPGIIAFLLVAMLMHVGPGAVAAPDNDDWGEIQGIAVGDHWNYSATGDTDGTIENEVVRITNKTSHFGDTWHTFVVASVADLRTAQGTEEEATQTDVKADVEIDLESEKWVRFDDYATVQIEGTTWVGGRENGKESRQLFSFDPPFVEDVFPFGLDYVWQSESVRYTEQGSEDPSTKEILQRARVLGKENVTVPAGTFSAFKVEYLMDGDRKLRWYVEEVCDLVKEEVYDPDGDLRARIELTSWSCSKVDKPNPVYRDAGVALTDGTPPVDEDIEPPPPTPNGPETPDPGSTQPEAAGPALWVALGVVVGSALALIVVGRRRI